MNSAGPTLIGEDDNTITIQYPTGEQSQVALPKAMRSVPGGVYDALRKSTPNYQSPYEVQPVQDNVVEPGANPPVQPQVQAPQSAVPPVVTLESRQETKTQTSVDPSVQKQFQQGIQGQQKVADELSGSITQAGTERDRLIQKQQALRGEEQQALQQGQQRTVERDQKYNDQLSSLLADYNASGIKPKSIMEEGNVGQNIMAGIAIALGAVGAAMTGSKENVALNIMNQAIERDLDAQRANLGKKKDSISQAGLVYEAAKKAGLSEEEARAKVFAVRYEQIADELRGVDGRVHDASKKADIANVLNGVLIEKAKFEAAANKTTTQTTVGEDQKPVDMSKIPNGNFEVPSDAQRAILGNASVVSKLDELKELRQLTREGGPIEGRLDRLKAKFGVAAKDESELVARANELSQKILNQLSGTAASDRQSEIIKTFTPDISDSDEQFEGKYNALRAGLMEEREGFIRAYGPQPKNMNYPWQASNQDKKSSVGFEP